MTTITCLVLTQTETVTKLHAALGSMRGWRDFLADCIRKRTSFHGLQLLPIGYMRKRCKRPVYAETAVDDFVAAALAIEAPKPIEPTLVDIAVVPAWVPVEWRIAVPSVPMAIR